MCRSAGDPREVSGYAGNRETVVRDFFLGEERVADLYLGSNKHSVQGPEGMRGDDPILKSDLNIPGLPSLPALSRLYQLRPGGGVEGARYCARRAYADSFIVASRLKLTPARAASNVNER